MTYETALAAVQTIRTALSARRAEIEPESLRDGAAWYALDELSDVDAALDIAETALVRLVNGALAPVRPVVCSPEEA